MKKIITTLTFFGLFLQFAFAQNSVGATVSGKLADSNLQPIAFATVTLNAAADSQMVKAGYTDEAGVFELVGIQTGQYFLKATFVGFQDYHSETFDLKEGQTLQLPGIALKDKAEALQEVVVVAQRPIVEVKPDRTVFNVEGTINATGHTALELLRKSPKVVVDNNNNIMIQGKSGVQIFIDGKPSPLRADDLASFLQNMQSNQVDAIEIITNPSSKFDAAGNAGIINIRLKKDKNLGTNGSVNLGYAVGTFPKYNGNVSLNHRNKWVNVFGTYGMNRRHEINFFNLDRFQFGTEYDQKNSEYSERFNQNARLGADFFLSKKSTLGVLLSGYDNGGPDFSTSRTEISDIATGNMEEILVATNDMDLSRENYNANLNYKYDAGNGKVLNIDGDYGNFQANTNSYQPNTYYDPTEQNKLNERIYTSEAPSDIQIATFKLDWEQGLWGGQLGVGVKNSYVMTDNVFDFFEILNGAPVRDIDRSNQFEYTENVAAAYANYQGKINDKWNYQLGLRGENTSSIGELTSEKNNDETERDYFDIFPSGGLTWQVNPKNSFSLTYSKRIDRPSYQDLNPFQFKLDELTFRQGNERLKPQYTHSVEIGHSFNYSLNSSLGYSYTVDMFADLTDVQNDSASFIKAENLAEQQIVTFNVSYPYSPKKWWNTFTNINAFRSYTEADFGVDPNTGASKIIDLTVTTVNIYMQHSFTLMKGLTLELSGFYNSPSVWGGVHKTESMWSMDAGLQQKLFNGKGNLKLTVSDLFYTQKWRASNTFGELTLYGNGGWESRQFRVNFNYLFGSQTVKGARRRTTGMEDESKRIKG